VENVEKDAFKDFVQAVEDSAPSEQRVRETRHTSSVSSSDWDRVEATRNA
jgi:hypothetical protein